MLLLVEELQEQQYHKLLACVEADLNKKFRQLIRKDDFVDHIYIDTSFELHLIRRQNVEVSALQLTAKKHGAAALKPLFQSKFRNCMMHYNLAGYDVLSQEYINSPFYGMVETCFEGKSYHSYLSELRILSDRITDYLESRFDFSKIILQEL